MAIGAGPARLNIDRAEKRVAYVEDPELQALLKDLIEATRWLVKVAESR